MTDLREGYAVSVLPESGWDARLAGARETLPFARTHWLALGLKGSPGLRFSPTVVEWGRSGELLLPLCVSGTRAQIGCYGYGSVAVSADWRGALPDFADLAEAVCRERELTELTTLLPPAEAFPGPEPTAHWTTRPGRDTYLLDLTPGVDALWRAARGRCRTAVRRAEALGLVAAAAEPGHGTELARLYGQTLGRHGIGTALAATDVEFLTRGGDTLTTVVSDRDGVQAASVFAVGGRAAFHLMQLTSERGRAANAGHLAFWTAVAELARRGTGTADLGAAAGEGQAGFKTGWGASAAAARTVRWPHGTQRTGEGQEEAR
ncbi:hypothetical protein [Streptomyces sp. NPDC005017]|uniref:hypothetical protein n=1 Tax=Streptomyces sp. NPDC005017 TaxID=3364706 RepID=UPI00368E7257